MRLTLTITSVLFGLLLLANLPFYSGSTLGAHYSWRMEHGRVTVERRESQNPQGFWVAGNSEGLRWSLEGRNHGGGHWELTVPLWIPLAFSVAGMLIAFRRRQDGEVTNPG